MPTTWGPTRPGDGRDRGGGGGRIVEEMVTILIREATCWVDLIRVPNQVIKFRREDKIQIEKMTFSPRMDNVDEEGRWAGRPTTYNVLMCNDNDNQPLFPVSFGCWLDCEVRHDNMTNFSTTQIYFHSAIRIFTNFCTYHWTRSVCLAVF